MNNRYLLERLAGRDPNLRASDADRERVIDLLKAAFVDGVLTRDEFGVRAGHALEARCEKLACRSRLS